MRRADRLFQIILILSRRRFATAKDLAESLEVSPRTVYRDVQDLSLSGVPILGEAGVGYQLDPSYRLPPLMFKAEEVEALVVGMRMVEAWGDSELRSSARSILEKVSAVLPDAERDQLASTALFSLSFGAGERSSRNLTELRHAINEQASLRLSYVSEAGESTRRTVRPLGLYFWGRTWTLAAYCELREDFRNFRTDRIETLERTGEHFELVPPCTLRDYIRAMETRD